MICKNCNCPDNEEKAKFCRNCGNPLIINKCTNEDCVGSMLPQCEPDPYSCFCSLCGAPTTRYKEGIIEPRDYKKEE